MTYSITVALDRLDKLSGILSFCSTETASAIRKDIRCRLGRLLYNDSILDHKFPEETLIELKNICDIVCNSYNNWSGERGYWYSKRNDFAKAISDYKKGKKFLKNVGLGDFVRPNRNLSIDKGVATIGTDTICEVKYIRNNTVTVRVSGMSRLIEIPPCRLILMGKRL